MRGVVFGELVPPLAFLWQYSHHILGEKLTKVNFVLNTGDKKIL